VELTLTGERTLPGIAAENYWFRRHEAAYRGVLPWLAGADVLEAGAGEGYGADLLAGTARRVVALDHDDDAVRHLARTYGQGGGGPAGAGGRVTAVRGNLVAMPFRAGAFDAVVSLQVVEHLWDQPGFVAECARVLRPAGTLVVSTPNRLTFSPGHSPGDPPANLFHSRELDARELADLLAPRFRLARLLGLHPGRRLRRLDRRHAGLVAAQLAAPPAVWHPALRLDVASVRADDFVLRAAGRDGGSDDVDRSLDLVAVAVRR